MRARCLVVGIGIEPISEPYQDSANPSQLTDQCHGATGVIRTRGFRDLQSLALGLSATVALFGWRYRDRTDDIRCVKPVLYQLS